MLFRHENGAEIELREEHANLAEREGFVRVEEVAEKPEEKKGK